MNLAIGIQIDGNGQLSGLQSHQATSSGAKYFLVLPTNLAIIGLKVRK